MEPSGAERSRAEPSGADGAERSRAEPSGARHPVFEWFERGVEQSQSVGVVLANGKGLAWGLSKAFRAEPSGAERSRAEPSGAGHPVFEWFERGVELGALLFL